jgi:hypothetical protein
MSTLPAPARFDTWPFRLALGGIDLVVFGLVALLYVAGPGSLYHHLLLTWGGETSTTLGKCAAGPAHRTDHGQTHPNRDARSIA